ncbi:bifunctional (p)ppGpp synthetase/guanosine-3',5'-bis(diphosphate) 3'-pyrophosphohydrolase [Viridibacterium curvum]
MVSVQHSVANTSGDASLPDLLAEGLGPTERAQIAQAVDWAQSVYTGHVLGSGEGVWQHALGMALIAVSLRLDVDARLAALLFAVGEGGQHDIEQIEARFGAPVARLVEGLSKLNRLRMLSRPAPNATAADLQVQTETLRKMVLAMAEDLRVILLRLASRVQTLRFFTENREQVREDIARESIDLFAPLANRLGVWQLKWELEDLSFRFLEPDTYKRVAKMLDERRVEREAFIADAIERLRSALEAEGIKAEIYGRPKHIFSIYNKMRAKHLDFEQVYDVRALRVLVDDISDCYGVLSHVHSLWTPIANEFDDYIRKPKGNNYQSLHTAVRAADGRALEVQIRTHDMHKHAELGVAAHWRYKEGATKADGDYDEKIALLRQLLSWRDEVTDVAEWEEHTRRAALDDTIYVVTPQGRVLDLAAGATPIDFAYRLHTDLGHRCRGAKVDGVMVPLDTPLSNGQVVEIITTKIGGPSRDWLNPQLGYLVTSNARAKVRRWFVQQEEEETASQGRAIVMRELQRAGQTQANLDELAGKLNFKETQNFFIAVGRGDVSARQIHNALQVETTPAEQPDLVIGERRAAESADGILIVGVGQLLTQLARCCKPVPPDPIKGFVTRGRGVSIHRADCRSYLNIAHRHPERIVPADWGGIKLPAPGTRSEVYPVDIAIEANDRSGLLRDISDVFSRDKFNVIGVNTVSRGPRAYMRFTVEVASVELVQRILQQVSEVEGVVSARRC